ncbi:ABC transporter permease [Pseudanabaena sp. PCC 6802]|uniref:ABC transporter permease n=1 Tax=Pseudanabaena sp. PCC 6802 TaxID=118173 RepID=UPI000346EEAD|nr:ABC transporter permease [Pseudanabaena sp. PCC 6802]
MDIFESFNMAMRTIAANRMRSTLTMLGIIIGNASVIAMIGIGQGAQKYASSQFQSLGTDVLFVIPGSDNTRRNTIAPPNRLVLADADAIATQVPTVKQVAPQVNGSELATYRNQTKRSTLIGTTPSYSTVRNAGVSSGRFLSEDDLKRNARVVTLGSAIARDLFGQSNPIGQQVRIKGMSFEVIGVMDEKGAFLGTNQDDTIFMPFTTMSSRLIGRTSPYGIAVQAITVSARDTNSIDAAKFQIENLLRLRHQSKDAQADETFTIRTQKDALEIVNNITGALTLMLAAIAGISLLVGGIGIMNIMLVSVTERTQEIGLRKALGATQADILTQFTIEAVILSVAGGLVGTCLGVGGVLLVATYTPLQAGVSGGAIAVAVGVSGAIGLFFGIFPARQAAKLDPIVALRTV